MYLMNHSFHLNPELPETPLLPLEPEVPDDPLVPLEPELPEEPLLPLEPDVPDEPLVPLLPLYRDWETDRKSTRLNSSHSAKSRMPSSA